MKNYSLAIFGSSVRSDFDQYSDKDLLLVGSSYSTIKELKEKLENKGFSVSSYSYKKLKLLSEKGNLFLDHLRRDSEILIDFENQLSNIISNHTSKIPSIKKIEESKSFFQIIEFIPESDIGYAWFCDCFYVGLRNYLILNSARRQEYNFSFITLLQECERNQIIDKNQFAILRELRVIKRNYRSKIDDGYPDKSYIQQVILIGTQLGIFNRPINIISYLEFQQLASKKLLSDSNNNYMKLRIAEMYYNTLGISGHQIELAICNPQMYAGQFRNTQYVSQLLLDFKAFNNGVNYPNIVQSKQDIYRTN